MDMDVKEFLSKNNKKILVVDSISIGNALRRKCNIEEGICTYDVMTFTPLNIATELVYAYNSMSGIADTNIIDSESAAYLFDDVLADNCPSFIPKQSLTISTVTQIYGILSTIRSFDKTKKYEATDVSKIKEIKSLIKAYETCLYNGNLYDSARVISEAVGILEKAKAGELEYELSFYLPWIKDCIFGDLKNNNRKGLFNKFITLLIEVVGANLYSIDCFAYSDIAASQTSGIVDWDFFVSYGQHNEVSHVADKILELTRENKNSFDQINIFYTGQEYENYIAGIFDYAGIPYEFKEGYHALNTEFVQAIIEVLSFVASDYQFSELEKFILNDAVTYRSFLQDSRYINPNRGYEKTPGDKIGWGRNRYVQYINSDETKDMINAAKEYAMSLKDASSINDDKKEDGLATLTDEQRKKYARLNQGYFAILLSEIMDIFDEDISLSTSFEKLISFAGKYTYSKNIERNELLAELKKQVKVFEFVSTDRCKTASDKIEYIRNYIDNLTFSRRTGNVAVSIHKVSGFEVIERPVNFLIGMTAKQFAINTTESAVMSDSELIEYLAEADNVLAKNRNIKRQTEVEMLMRTLKRGSIIIGYSKYNTVDLKESSPSVIVMEWLGDRKLSDTVSYKPFIGEAFVDGKEYRDWIDSQTEDEKKIERKPIFVAGTEANISASELQILLECPIKYYYKCMRKISVPVTRVIKGDEWLSAMDRGNLFHRVAEHYMRRAMPPYTSISGELDKALFEEIYNEQIAQIETEVPWASEAVKAQEILEYKKVTSDFLTDMHASWKEDASQGRNWWILGCELDFEFEDNLIYEDNGEPLASDLEDLVNEESKGASTDLEDITDEESKSESTELKKAIEGVVSYPYRIHFRRGQIDRLDGYVDEDGYLNLRIIDYKTGKKDNKQKEINQNIQIQHHVYAMAAFNYIRKLKDGAVSVDKNIFDAFNIKGVKLEEVAYEFPLEDKNNRLLSAMDRMEGTLTVDENDPFMWSVGFPDGVRRKLRKIEGYRQCGDIDNIAGNMADMVPKSCTFCDYIKICRTKCGVVKPVDLGDEEDY